MDTRPKILAVIPARGGSKTIPMKNIKHLCGRPLIEYTFDAAKASGLLERVIVSTDDEQIAQIARRNKIEVPFMRPANLAKDDSPTLPVIQHAVVFLQENENYRPDYVVILQPTSPLRTETHIDEAIQILIDTGADSVVSVTEVPHQYNPCSIMKKEQGRLLPFIKGTEAYTRRQLKPVFYARNGAAIYALRYDTLINKKSLYGDDCRPYLMSKADSVDIDDAIDFKFAEFILSGRLESQV
jgi:CMP-N,N'-diacetyllegionaminic acid synthase